MSRPLHALSLLTLSVCLAACSDPAEESRDAGPDATVDTSFDATDISRAGCPEGASCFAACGLDILQTDPPVTFGLARWERVAVRARDVVRAGDALVSVDGYAVSVRDTEDVGLRGELPAAGLLIDVTVVGDTVFASGNRWGLTVADIDPTGSPNRRAFWAPPVDEYGASSVFLAGHSGDRLVLGTADGLSFLDVGDPDTPFETECLAYPGEYAWTVAVNDRFLVIAGGGEEGPASAWVYDLTDDEPSLVEQRSIQSESRVFLDDDRLLSVDSEGDLVLSELSGDGTSHEIARRASDREPNTWGTTEAGGFVLALERTEGSALGVDLRASDASDFVYRGPDPDSAPCVLTASPVDAGDTWFLSPWTMPDTRFPGSEAPPSHLCPEPDPTLGRVLDGAREPGGGRLVLRDDDGVTWLREASGGVLTQLQIGGDALFWSGAHIVAPTTTGADFGITIESSLQLADPEALFGDPVTLPLPAPLIDVAASDDQVWVLMESQSREYGEAEAAPEARQLAWVDPQAAPLRLNLVSREDTALLTGLGSAGSRILVFEEDGDVRIYEPPDDTPALTLPLPAGFVVSSLAGSSLGGFLADPAGELLWLDVDGGAIRECDAECGAVYPLAADASDLYARVPAPGPNGFGRPESVVVLEPVPNGSGFSLDARAAWPIADTGALAFPGETLFVATPQLVTLTLRGR